MFHWKAPWMLHICHTSLYVYPSTDHKIPYMLQDLRLPWRVLPFSRKVSSWIHLMVYKIVHMISSRVLTSAKSSLSRCPEFQYNSQRSLYCFLVWVALIFHRIFFHMISSTYHYFLYILRDLVYRKGSLLSSLFYFLALRSMICRVYYIHLHLQ